MEHGFRVEPNRNCPHIANPSFVIHSKLQPKTDGPEGKALKSNLFRDYSACSTCDDASESWICLSCAISGCSRYKKAHMVEHMDQKTSDELHTAISISLSDLSVWCFKCDEYIIHPKLDRVFRELHFGKFGSAPKANMHSLSVELGYAFNTPLAHEGRADQPSTGETRSDQKKGDEAGPAAKSEGS